MHVKRHFDLTFGGHFVRISIAGPCSPSSKIIEEHKSLFTMATSRWNPDEILHLEALSDSDIAEFTCVGVSKKDNDPCQNRIKKTNREMAQRELRTMSMIGINAHDFKDSLKELAERLLCGQAKHKTSQCESKVEEWSELIRNAAREARRGGDTPMGEQGDNEDYLRSQMDDAEELFRRQRIS